MKQRTSVLSRNVILVTALFGVVCAARPATAAQFLYDTSVSYAGQTYHTEFTEPAILTSLTTVTSFTVVTVPYQLVNEVLAPTSADSCVAGSFFYKGPCLRLNFINSGSIIVTQLPQFTSVGTYINPNGQASLEISQVSAAPEPSSIVLLSLLGTAAFAFRERLNPRRYSRGSVL